MSKSTKQRAKQIGFIALVSVLTVTVINTVAKRNKTVAKVRDTLATGV